MWKPVIFIGDFGISVIDLVMIWFQETLLKDLTEQAANWTTAAPA